MLTFPAPAKPSANHHLDEFLQLHKIKLPDDLYLEIANAMHERESKYTGVYMPAGIDKNGNLFPSGRSAGVKPPKPGELLTAWTNDPGFRGHFLDNPMNAPAEANVYSPGYEMVLLTQPASGS